MLRGRRKGKTYQLHVKPCSLQLGHRPLHRVVRKVGRERRVGVVQDSEEVRYGESYLHELLAADDHPGRCQAEGVDKLTPVEAISIPSCSPDLVPPVLLQPVQLLQHLRRAVLVLFADDE